MTNFGSNTVKGPPTMYPKRQFIANADGSYREVVEAGVRAASGHDTSTGAALSVTLDTGEYGKRDVVEVWVKSSASATFTIQVSTDNTNWRTVGSIVLTAAGEQLRGYKNAYRYIKVGTTAANNNEIEIAAS